MTGRWSRARPSGEAENDILIYFQMISSIVASPEMKRKERKIGAMPKRASLGHGQKSVRLRLHFFEFPCYTCRYRCRGTKLYHVQWGRTVIVMGDRLGMSRLGGFYVATAGAQQSGPEWVVPAPPPCSLEETTAKRLQT
jgi:hypothetical protein